MRWQRIYLSFFVLILCMVFVVRSTDASSETTHNVHGLQIHQTQPQHPTVISKLQLDSRLPTQTYAANKGFGNTNSKFGSRFDFNPQTASPTVWSGTDGVFHDNNHPYVVGVTPNGKAATDSFTWGGLNIPEGDNYLNNEKWTLGLTATRWEGDAHDQRGLHVTVDLIQTLGSEPGCTNIANCGESVKDDTLPALLVGVTLTNGTGGVLSGKFIFGSDRPLNSCSNPSGTNLRILQYAASTDKLNGTLFIGGTTGTWVCYTGANDRIGLDWPYSIAANTSTTRYLILGGWNTRNDLFMNTRLPAGCQGEPLYYTKEFSGIQAVIQFSLDNLTSGDNLLQRAQNVENNLINNNVLTSAQRWVIADSMHSYIGDSWLVARQSCAGSGYDAAVYEGTYGFLSTLDVMHENSYFEINQIPWFFRSQMQTLYDNKSIDSFGTYIRHDIGSEIAKGACSDSGNGTPEITATVLCVWETKPGIFGTEENSDATLLTAYYYFVTKDISFVTSNIATTDSLMLHQQKVADPNTGIAYHSQDTSATYDDSWDCIHASPDASTDSGDTAYTGVKEAAAYHAAAYLDSIGGSRNGLTWTAVAQQIENALMTKYVANGFIPTGLTTAYNDCSSRSSVIGDGLFYLSLIGHISDINSTLLKDIAIQYPEDVSANTISQYNLVTTESARSNNSRCPSGGCPRSEWFSKEMLSSIIADTVYTANGCKSCTRIDLTTKAYMFNVNSSSNYQDGQHDNGSAWKGGFYPRALISWMFLSNTY
jgi:hypothetical protein